MAIAIQVADPGAPLTLSQHGAVAADATKTIVNEIAFQAALDAIPTNGRRLHIPGETYYLNALSTPAKRGAKIEGDGGVGYWDDDSGRDGAQTRLIYDDATQYSDPTTVDVTALLTPLLFVDTPGLIVRDVMLFGKDPVSTIEPSGNQADVGVQIPSATSATFGSPGKCVLENFYWRNFNVALLFGELDGSAGSNADNTRLAGLHRFDGCVFGLVMNSVGNQNIFCEQVNWRRGECFCYIRGGGQVRVETIETLTQGGTIWRVADVTTASALLVPTFTIENFHSDALASTPLYPFMAVNNDAGSTSNKYHHFSFNSGDWGNAYLYGGANKNGGAIVELYGNQKLSMRDMGGCYPGMIATTNHSNDSSPQIISDGCHGASGTVMTVGGIPTGAQHWVEPTAAGGNEGNTQFVGADAHQTVGTGSAGYGRRSSYTIRNEAGVSTEVYAEGTLYRLGLRCFANGTNVSVGDGAATFTCDSASGLAGKDLIGVGVYTPVAGSGSQMNITIRNVTQAAEMLTGNLVIPAGDNKGQDGDYTIDTAEDDITLNDQISVNVDQVHTTPAEGMLVWLLFQ